MGEEQQQRWTSAIRGSIVVVMSKHMKHLIMEYAPKAKPLTLVERIGLYTR